MSEILHFSCTKTCFNHLHEHMLETLFTFQQDSVMATLDMRIEITSGC